MKSRATSLPPLLLSFPPLGADMQETIDRHHSGSQVDQIAGHVIGRVVDEVIDLHQRLNRRGKLRHNRVRSRWKARFKRLKGQVSSQAILPSNSSTPALHS